MTNYRYPGAQPFSTAQENIFFGRVADIEALYRQIKLEPLVVLYSKSGLGKSSLLNAGIIPRIEEEGRYLPVTIRFNAYSPNGEETIAPAQTTFATIRSACQHTGASTFLDHFLPAEDSLWFLLKKEQAFTTHRQQLLLIFDQFEELYTYPEAAIRDFKQQLAEVMHTQIPQRFRERVEREVESPSRLQPDQLALLHQPFEARVVFAIRSDRISLLDKIADRLPLVKRSWYELDALSEEQAEEAILSPAYKKGDFVSPVFDYEDGAIEKILDFLTQGGKQKIESFQLQILCQAIERKVIQQDLRLVTLTDLGNIQEVYENYYEDQIRLLEDPEEQLAARRLIEEGLIFEEEERRLSLYEGQIFTQYQLSEALLRKLENTHLIRREPSMRGGYTYELSHDTLVAPVLKAKAARLEEERRQAAEAERLQKERELAEAQLRAAEERELRGKAERNEKRARQRTRIAGIISLVAIILAILSAFLYNQAQNKTAEAEKANENLEIEKQNALDAKEKADHLAKVAEDTAKVAVELREQAQEESRKALEAEAQTRKALSDLEATASQTVLLLLRETDNYILQLEYDTALVRCLAARNLGAFPKEVNRRFQEIAYFFMESDQKHKTISLFNAIGNNLPGQSVQEPEWQQKLRSEIQKLAPENFRKLENRYYLEMVPVAGGSFEMGCKEGRDKDCEDNEMLHYVQLGSFSIARTETTVWQYNLYCLATGQDSIERTRESWGLWGNNPVVNVSWYHAVAYANWVSKQRGYQPVYTIIKTEKDTNNLSDYDDVKWIVLADSTANGLRLPTEAEWEYAARGGQKSEEYNYSGSDQIEKVAWYGSNAQGRTQAVAHPEKQANELGIYDMSGNVLEWCWDWYGDYPSNTPPDFRGPDSGLGRVLRGGSWYSIASYARVSYRYSDRPGLRVSNGGFRLARAR